MRGRRHGGGRLRVIGGRRVAAEGAKVVAQEAGKEADGVQALLNASRQFCFALPADVRVCTHSIWQRCLSSTNFRISQTAFRSHS